ncbi:substrate-binding domain-containing protein [Schlesneria paludicola]|uniref:substrate-binding domain-containing protein n=1 Tax=Schlesneria paludicola TaxID=360056 RepID=UPI00029A931D|nr:substrate-binding domain-containing protein [Schlesneria paludicola]
MSRSINRSLILIPVVAALVLAGMWLAIAPDSLIVYCAHDAEYAQQILNDFSRKTGIPVEVRFDTEATKSLGLINLIVQERDRPRCDVFWNNELLGMVELREQGLLESYQGVGWNRIPDQFRDEDGYWVGFAARMRVCLFNTHQAPASIETLQHLISTEPTRFAIAKPLFGTTLTHYTVLWHLWGGEQLQEWHRDLRLRGVREVDGNAAVKDVVAMGTCDAGLTDSDDAFVALDNQAPVEMLPAYVMKGASDSGSSEGGTEATDQSTSRAARPTSHTICIPNTVGIIQGTRRPEAARKLVDYLASEEAELALARAKSRQIPLGAVQKADLPEDVRKLAEWAKSGIDLRPMLNDRRECLVWLTKEYLK